MPSLYSTVTDEVLTGVLTHIFSTRHRSYDQTSRNFVGLLFGYLLSVKSFVIVRALRRASFVMISLLFAWAHKGHHCMYINGLLYRCLSCILIRRDTRFVHVRMCYSNISRGEYFVQHVRLIKSGSDLAPYPARRKSAWYTPMHFRLIKNGNGVVHVYVFRGVCSYVVNTPTWPS